LPFTNILSTLIFNSRKKAGQTNGIFQTFMEYLKSGLRS